MTRGLGLASGLRSGPRLWSTGLAHSASTPGDEAEFECRTSNEGLRHEH
jgi:hypothetical protein